MKALQLLERIRQWDMLDASSDGQFWKREIDTVLEREKILEETGYDIDETPAEEVLRAIACFLGVGGYNSPKVDADIYRNKIIEAIQEIQNETNL